MINFLIIVLTKFARFYLIRRFVIFFLNDTKPDKKKEIFICGAFFVISTGAYLIFDLVYVNVICSIAGISMLVLLRPKPVKMYLLAYSFYFICECIVATSFADYKEGQEENQFLIILENFLIFVCGLVMEKIVRHPKNEDIVQSIPIVLVPLSSVITVLILAGINNKAVVLIVAVNLLIINFLFYYLYDIVIHTACVQYENELLRKQMQGYENQICTIMQGQDKIKCLRHDLRHHMSELQYLIEKKEKKDAVSYIDDMKSFLQNPDEIVGSSNVEMDSLLNCMLQQAKRDLITVNVRVTIPENIIPVFDINMILGNLLQNAIEAARQSEEKTLEALIYYKQGVMTIDIKNSFAGQLKKTQNNFLTTKAEKDKHGIGLNSVKHIVEKYRGLLKIETQENLFCVNVILYVNCKPRFPSKGESPVHKQNKTV